MKPHWLSAALLLVAVVGVTAINIFQANVITQQKEQIRSMTRNANCMVEQSYAKLE